MYKQQQQKRKSKKLQKLVFKLFFNNISRIENYTEGKNSEINTKKRKRTAHTIELKKKSLLYIFLKHTAATTINWSCHTLATLAKPSTSPHICVVTTLDRETRVCVGAFECVSLAYFLNPIRHLILLLCFFFFFYNFLLSLLVHGQVEMRRI